MYCLTTPYFCIKYNEHIVKQLSNNRQCKTILPGMLNLCEFFQDMVWSNHHKEMQLYVYWCCSDLFLSFPSQHSACHDILPQVLFTVLARCFPRHLPWPWRCKTSTPPSSWSRSSTSWWDNWTKQSPCRPRRTGTKKDEPCGGSCWHLSCNGLWQILRKNLAELGTRQCQS